MAYLTRRRYEAVTPAACGAARARRARGASARGTDRAAARRVSGGQSASASTRERDVRALRTSGAPARLRPRESSRRRRSPSRRAATTRTFADAAPKLGKRHAAAQAMHVFGGEPPGDCRAIGLLDAEARVQQPVCEVAIVGEQQRAARRIIQAPDGKHSRTPHEIQNGRRPCGSRIVVTTPTGLFKQHIRALIRNLDDLAIHLNPIAVLNQRARTRSRRLPLTATRPLAMSSSACLREATPARARNLLSRTARRA